MIAPPLPSAFLLLPSGNELLTVLPNVACAMVITISRLDDRQEMLRTSSLSGTYWTTCVRNSSRRDDQTRRLLLDRLFTGRIDVCHDEEVAWKKARPNSS